MRLSLATKAYLYGLAMLLVLLPATTFGGQALARRAMQAGILPVFTREADFVALEVQATLRDGRPSEPRMRALGDALHLELRYVPWAEAPAGLRTARAVGQPVGATAPRWVRLEQAGRPVGALAVRLLPPGPPPRPPVAWVAAWVALWAAMVVVPFWWWVIRPLRAMVAIAHRLAAGGLDQPVAATRRDEFGELERAFEVLRERVQAMLGQRERLLRDISHELRAPLQRMSLAIPQLREDPALEPLVEADIREVDAMVGELLDFMRVGQAAMVLGSFDLAELVGDLVAARRLLIETGGQDVRWTLAPVQMEGDLKLVARAVGNVIDNALKYTPAGGSVRIACGPALGGACFEVVDDGPGIPAADLPHVLEPFYRPDSSRSRATGGSGLGLAIVRAAAEAHGGHVTVSSVEGKGTLVRLHLPTKALTKA